MLVSKCNGSLHQSIEHFLHGHEAATVDLIKLGSAATTLEESVEQRHCMTAVHFLAFTVLLGTNEWRVLTAPFDTRTDDVGIESQAG